MNSKIQELTDKLFEEGLSKGRQEAEKMLEDARAQSAGIISNAKKEAEAIIENARKEAENVRSKAESDIRSASSQCLQATRNDIETLIVGKISGEEIKSACRDGEFIKGIIREVAGKFSSEQSCDLSLVLPEQMKGELEDWVKSSLSKELDKKINATFSKKVSGGFTIGPSDGSYFISFDENTFRELIGEYLRPVTRKILFG